MERTVVAVLVDAASDGTERDAFRVEFGLRTRSVASDDEWIINGHRIRPTAGLMANWIFG
jgi:hypothetical protein